MKEVTVHIGPLQLQDGSTLEAVRQRVTIYGDPSARTVLIPHALTGSSRVYEWWGELAGTGKLIDPQEYRIVGINALGGCYGSTGPRNGEPFPYVTVRDIVAAQARALAQLGITKLSLVIGASLGGMQALQWAIDFPDLVERAVMVGSHDHQSSMGIALNAIQRDAIALDPVRGLRIARKIAMLSYKSDELFKARHDRRPDRKSTFRYDIEGYLEHQADIFEARMHARSYVALTHAMDSFDVRRGEVSECHPEPQCHPEVSKDSRGIEAPQTRPELLFVGISSDRLFLPEDVRAAAHRFASAGYVSKYAEIESDHGHDAFLAEPEKLAAIVRRLAAQL